MMKQLLTTLFTAVFCVGLFAQSQTPLEKAMRHVEIKAEQWQLIADDYTGAIVSDMYTDSKTGNTYIYLQQAIDGIPVSNAITPFVVSKEGKVMNVASRFIPHVKSRIKSNLVNVPTNDAIKFAAEALGVVGANVAASRSTSNNGVDTYSNLDFVHNEVKVKKEYVLLENELVLTWNMSLDLKGTADYWNTNVSVEDGSLVAKHNYTVYCNHDHIATKGHSNCGASHKSETKSAVSMEAATASMMMGATYKAFQFPTESPIHGEITTFGDDLYPDMSPFGWHDVDGQDGADYTITRGNNVWAFLDKENTDFSSGDEPDGGAELNFNFPYDLESQAEENESSSVVNLFTTINQIHDITKRLGFTTESGAFQQNNYGESGAAGDPVLAQAFDGIDAATPTLNNANFSTPSDGGSGRMQMFLWENGGGSFSIDEPGNIAGFVNPIGTADYGNPIPANAAPAIEGEIALALDGTPASSTQNCEDVVNSDIVSGKIAMVDRGLCNFSLKSFNVQRAGAIACIICNVPGADGAGSSGENTINMTGGDNADEVTIPSIFVQKSVCDRIKAELAAGVAVRATLKTRDPVGPTYRDASFDLGVVAHEYGHGISNRIIGGPSAAGCLGNAEQMGEGISDFVALLLTVEEGDTRADARGIGNYVDFLPAEGGGIRTYPYSTDLSINPRNYSEMPGFLDADGAPLIYSVGELWTIAAWEMYWNIVDKKGLDTSWENTESGNFIAGKLIMEGMKLAPCSPSLINMRDAIIAADILCYDGAHELEIWSAFAKRGIGWKATGQSGGSITDGEANYDVYPLAIKTLKIEKSANTLIEAGDEVEITLTANNHIPETRNGIVITDQIPEGATFVEGSASSPLTQDGAQLTFDIGDMEYEDELVITYKIKVNSDLTSNTIFYDGIEDASKEYPITFPEGFNLWVPTEEDAYKGERSLYANESATEENDQTIQIDGIQVTGQRPILRFFHKYDTEPVNDGGFVRISNDGGTVFNLVPEKFIRNGYNTDLDYSTFAIPNLRGYSGSSDGEWVDSYVDLSEYNGQTISVQFRFGTNATIAANVDNPGWFVDDVEIFDLKSFSSVACINSDQPDEEQCSNMLEFIINSNGVVGIEDERFEHLSIGIAPNPAQDYVTVRVNSDRNESLMLELTSVDGKFIGGQSILGSSAAVRTFDVSNLQSGVYFLTVRSENNVVTTEKIVIE